MSGTEDKRYDTVFLDVDGTLLWVDMDVEGYVEDLAPYSSNGPLTAERAAGPVWESLKRHISENINYRSREELGEFKQRNAEETARKLGLDAPTGVLVEVADRRIHFNPYPESERVLKELRSLGLRLYVVSNWDVLLEEVLEELGWRDYFEAIVTSAVVGIEKPQSGIFEEALRVSGREEAPGRTIHVGNDPVSDIRGAAEAGLDSVFIDRKGGVEAVEATATLPDLNGLPALLGAR